MPASIRPPLNFGARVAAGATWHGRLKGIINSKTTLFFGTPVDPPPFGVAVADYLIKTWRRETHTRPKEIDEVVLRGGMSGTYKSGIGQLVREVPWFFRQEERITNGCRCWARISNETQQCVLYALLHRLRDARAAWRC